MDNQRIGRRIRKARLSAQLTQDDLGQKTGFSQKTISLLERGGVGAVTIETLQAIARATRHPLAYFIEDAPKIAAGLAEVLRQQHPGIDEATIREIEAFVSWAVYRDRQVDSERSGQSDGTSAADSEGTNVEQPGSP